MATRTGKRTKGKVRSDKRAWSEWQPGESRDEFISINNQHYSASALETWFKHHPNYLIPFSAYEQGDISAWKEYMDLLDHYRKEYEKKLFV